MSRRLPSKRLKLKGRKLTRLIFEFPKNVLKLTSYEPVEKQSIKFRNLEVEFGTQGGTRDGIYE